MFSECFAENAFRLAIGINIGRVPLLAVSYGMYMFKAGTLTVLIPLSYAAFKSGSAYNNINTCLYCIIRMI